MDRLPRWLAALALAVAPALAHGWALPGFHDLERSLHLNAAQKAQFDVALGATQNALLSVALGAVQLKDHIAAELAKPRPDLAEIARAQNAIVERSRPQFRAARREWRRFYAMLDPSQERRARAFVEDKLRELERMGARLRGLLPEGAKR